MYTQLSTAPEHGSAIILNDQGDTVTHTTRRQEIEQMSSAFVPARPPADTARPEVTVDTDWTTLLDATPGNSAVRSSTLGSDFPEAHDVHGILSAAECDRIIAAAENCGFGYTPYPKSYRGNLRLIADDPGLAKRMWTRIMNVVPARQIDSSGEVWEAVGLNTHWRLSKYYPGDQFKQHVDAAFCRDIDCRSMYTVNIYLNGGFEGGATRFYELDSRAPRHSLSPSPGLAVIFRQPPEAQLLHDGEALRTGMKYLLRSDVMYERLARPRSGPC